MAKPTYKELISLFIDSSPSATNPSALPKYAKKFAEEVYVYSRTKKHKLAKDLKIDPEHFNYQIPFNYIISKLGSKNGEFSRKSLNELLFLVKNKIDYDLYSRAQEIARNKALLYDQDIEL